jgi:hypothetical protein
MSGSQVMNDQTPNFYVTPEGAQGSGNRAWTLFEDVRTAARTAGITSIGKYWHWSRANQRNGKSVPTRPDQIYAGRGWVSWNHFLRGDK